MQEVEITTLTSVHVGSGTVLQQNTDFVKVNADTMYVVDDRKVFELIGIDNVQKWVLSIERQENLLDFLKYVVPGCNIRDCAMRELDLFGKVLPSDTLKEQIHDGRGYAYIPGSSIKGAIRTAVLASEVEHVEDKETKIILGRKVSASRIEKELFGDDPKKDIFRFLQVGDATFKKGSEIAVKAIMGLNITASENVKPSGEQKPQLIEVIRPNVTTKFKMKLDTSRLPSGSVESLSSLSHLFKIINEHTLSLINHEIEYWENKSKQYSGAEDYLEQMRAMKDIADECGQNECVLRVGYGIGWNFITGGWARNLENFETSVVEKSRPNNRSYEEYDFPKSRRTDSDSELFGFVKLTLPSPN